MTLKANVITKEDLLGKTTEAVQNKPNDALKDLKTMNDYAEGFSKLVNTGIGLFDKVMDRVDRAKQTGMVGSGASIQDRKVQVQHTPVIIEQKQIKEETKVSDVDFKVSVNLERSRFKDFIQKLVDMLGNQLSDEYKEMKLGDLPDIYKSAKFLMDNAICDIFEQDLYSFLRIEKVLVEREKPIEEPSKEKKKKKK